MNKYSRLSLLLVCLSMVLISAAACVPVPAPLPATAAPSDALTNILWQWTSVTNQSTKQTTTIANPQNYTITFNSNGTLTGKADCNTFGGTYSQTNGFTIKLGPSTMAYCGEASLDKQYLTLLSSVAAGGPDGAGNLALETAGGEQRMLIKNGSVVATAPAPTPAPATAITNIVWQWTSVANRSTGAKTTVPNPQLYTIIFRADGTLSGKADCNTFTGTYSQQGGFFITAIPDVMAACGGDSLDQQYFQLLKAIVAGGPDGAGGLALETAGGEQRMTFVNGGPAPAP